MGKMCFFCFFFFNGENYLLVFYLEGFSGEEPSTCKVFMGRSPSQVCVEVGHRHGSTSKSGPEVRLT